VAEVPAPQVRAGRESDLPALTALYNHYVVSGAVTFDIEPFTVERRREWFGHYAPTGPHRLLVAVEGDRHERVVGYATSSPYRPKAAYSTTVETSVYCAPDACGRGIGGLLYDRLFAAIAGEDLHRAYAAITLPNEASVRLHRRFGFTEVGVFAEVGRKCGRYWDVQWLGRPLP
jgi:phosphinothricin acetyltransferase